MHAPSRVEVRIYARGRALPDAFWELPKTNIVLEAILRRAKAMHEKITAQWWRTVWLARIACVVLDSLRRHIRDEAIDFLASVQSKLGRTYELETAPFFAPKSYLDKAHSLYGLEAEPAVGPSEL